MLSENIRNLRAARGMTQAQLADRLHVVRQTVSKWEKGLSVPDADLLSRLAEALDTTVSVLLGETLTPADTPTVAELAAKLEELNTNLAHRSETRRKGWHIAFLVLLAFSVLSLAFTLRFSLPPSLLWSSVTNDVAIIGGADGPTAIFISDFAFRDGLTKMLLILSGIAAIIGIAKTRRR
ncbi:MAG: helix-turn-helix domain-containing protein [Clostridia bacterium]|nr:helix-turn-helix domain-containing protein [Clostridia bacterium]